MTPERQLKTHFAVTIENRLGRQVSQPMCYVTGGNVNLTILKLTQTVSAVTCRHCLKQLAGIARKIHVR